MFPSPAVPNAADRLLLVPGELPAIIQTSPYLSGIDSISSFLTHGKYIGSRKEG